MRSRAELGAELSELKRASSFSYKDLARSINRPVSTLHGWISATHLPHPRDNADFVALADLLGAADAAGLLASVAMLRGRSSDPGRNPYMGLKSFGEEDADLFFGREALTASLVERVLARRSMGSGHPLVVVGASGSGKTSLLRAGLLAQLQAHGDSMDLAYVTPSGTGAEDMLQALRPAEGSAARRVVVLDQLEECFSSAREGELDRAIGRVEEFCDGDDNLLVVGLRSDFFHRAAAVPLLLEGLQDNPLVVGPMSIEEVTKSIVEPPLRSGLEMAPDLLAALIHEFGDTRTGEAAGNSLPLLSHALHVLVESTSSTRLTLAAYRATGGLGSAIERSAEQILSSAHFSDAVCKLLFSQLVDLDVDTQPTRRVCEVDRLYEIDPEADFEALLAEFATHRLLTTDFRTVTISHEALLHAWPRLAGWIDEWRESAAAVSQVVSAASAWRQTERDPDALLRGARLVLAEELLSSPASSARLSNDDRQFVTAGSAAQHEREKQQRESMSRQLATQAELLGLTDPSIGAQAAIAAYSMAATVESRSALLGATSQLPGGRVLGAPGPTALAVSNTGERIAFSNAVDHSILVIDSSEDGETNRHILRCHADDFVAYALALSPDGQILAAAGNTQTVHLWDVSSPTSPVVLSDDRFEFGGPVHDLHFDQTGERLFTCGDAEGIACWRVGHAMATALEQVIPTEGTVLAISTGGDPGHLATGHEDGTVALWDLDRPSTPVWSQPAEQHGPAATVALSPDGRTLVAGYHSGLVRAWSVETKPLRITELELEAATFASWVNAVQFSDCGSILTAASSDGNVRLWRTSDWTRAHDDLRHPTVVTSVRFVNDRTLATTAEDGSLRTWDISYVPVAAKSESIWSVSYDNAGRIRVTASRTQVAIHEIDRDGLPILMRAIAPEAGAAFSGASAVSPDGEFVAIGSRTGPILISAIAGDGPTTKLEGLDSLVENVAFAPDQSLLCGIDRDGTALLWTLREPHFPRRAGSLRIEPPALCLAFSYDSTLLTITSESGHTTLIDIATPSDLQTLATIRTGDSFALGAAFHPDQPLLAVGNADRSVTMWDCTDPTHPELLSRLTGPAGHTMSVEFNQAGSLLAAGTTDGRIWLWDTARPADPPQLHAVLKSQEQGVYAMAFSPTHNTLTGAGPHQRVFTWILDEIEAEQAICRSIGDPMTRQEWEKHLPAVPYRKLCRD